MNNSSPAIHVPALAKAAVTAAETPAVANFVNLFTAGYTRTPAGQRKPNLSIMPEQEVYDRLEVSFGIPTLGGTVTALELTVYAWHPSGKARVLGKSVLGGDDLFPKVEFKATTEPIFVGVSTITGTSPALTAVDVFITGIHEEMD